MPGIAGIITRKPREQAAQELARMVASMRHEPFYVTGTWVDEGLGVYVGWAELEDPGRCAMPLRNESGDRVLVFCGDEFPAAGTAQGLRARGHHVCDSSNGHLVHLAEEDPRFPAGLNGQFQGLLADRRSGEAILFNDRLAGRRLYFHEARDGFYFAAEAKAILAARPQLRAVDERGLGEFVACGCVLEDRSLFKQIGILPWAAKWTFRNAALESRETYFNPREWEDQEALEPEAYCRQLRDVIANNLPRYFRDAGRIGMSLTGGLDTRMIMAWQKPASGTLPCYTFGGGRRECRDVRIARRVAQVCGQPYQVISIGEEFLARFPHLAERTVYLSDGYAEVDHAPDLYANRIAREIAPIRMTGNYGDEVLRHRMVFRPSMPADGVMSAAFLPQVSAAEETYARAFRGLSPTQAATRQVSWCFQGLEGVESSQVAMRTPFLDNDLIRTAYRAPSRTCVTNDVRVRIIRAGDPTLAKIRTDLGFAGRGGQVATAVSHFFHRATMRAEYACEHGDPPWVPKIDRALFGRRLEETFVGIHKFTHFAQWYRDALAGYVREILLDRRALSRPYVNANAVEAMVERHVKGTANHASAIHKLMTLEHFHRLFVDAQ